MKTQDKDNFSEKRNARFNANIMQLLERIEYRPINFSEDFDEIYKQRYKAYRREGFIEYDASKRCIDHLDEVKNVRHFGVYLDDELVSSIRIHHLTKENRQSCSMMSFADILDPLLDEGIEFVDPSRTAVCREACLRHPFLSYLTFRITVMAGDHYGTQFALGSVRPEHAAFFTRVLHGSKWSDVRNYNGLNFNVALYAFELSYMLPQVREKYAFFRSTQMERRMMFDRDEIGPAPMTVLPTAKFVDQSNRIAFRN